MSFELMNSLGKAREPFLFVINYDKTFVDVIPLTKLKQERISWSIDEHYTFVRHPDVLKKLPIDFQSYKTKFEYVIEKIKAGETYLLNLTQETKIQTPLSLEEIYKCANAPYKLLYKDKFVCFSPECFVKIRDNTIDTFPMKGTIDASIDNAKEKILSNKKEMAEHVMVVDLLRNDLSMVAQNVRVKKFRYIQKINAGEKQLLQVSSHISGELGEGWHESLGDILSTLLPAGSITGAPKRSTVEIIKETEGYSRGFFSGVFGVYDGKTLNSGVMIRFIEKKQKGLLYKSGGGITLDSDARSEYDEMLDKIYLP